jgi:hypothetical protein
MNCDRFQQELALVPIVRDRADLATETTQHVDGCASCTALLQDRIRLDLLLDLDPAIDAPVSLRDAVLARIDAAAPFDRTGPAPRFAAASLVGAARGGGTDRDLRDRVPLGAAEFDRPHVGNASGRRDARADRPLPRLGVARRTRGRSRSDHRRRVAHRGRERAGRMMSMNRFLILVVLFSCFARIDSAACARIESPRSTKWESLSADERELVQRRFELWKRMPEAQREKLRQRHDALVEVKAEVDRARAATPGTASRRSQASRRPEAEAQADPRRRSLRRRRDRRTSGRRTRRRGASPRARSRGPPRT